MAESLGVTVLGTTTADDLFASARPPRVKNVIVSTGEGVLDRGTLMSKDTDGDYIKHDGTKDIEGVLTETIDATSADVKTTLMFDCDLNFVACFSATTIGEGFDLNSLINFKEAY